MDVAALREKLDALPIKIRRTLLDYVSDGLTPSECAELRDIRVSAVYERLASAERLLGRPIPRHTRRGRPRK